MQDTINVFAFGQAGTRISQNFEKVGVSTAYVNFDEVDMRGLQVREDKKLCISGKGTGCSLAMGNKLVKKHKAELFKFIRSHADKNKLNIIVFGLGGGTGSSITMAAVPYMLEKGYRVGILTVLPPDILGILPQDNALRVLEYLKELPLSLFILGDNEYMVSEVGFKKDWWSGVNNYLFSQFHSIFEITRSNKTTYSGIGSIDKGELLRILQYGNGMLDVRTIYLKEADLYKSEETLRDMLYTPSLIDGYSYKDTLAYAVNVDVPSRGDYTGTVSTIFNIVEKESGEAISRLGMSIDPLLDDTIRITMINAGLKLPKTILSRIKNLNKNEKKFINKKEKEDKITFDKLNTSSLDDDFII